MTPTPGIIAIHPVNISTRLQVENGENVAIGGFVVAGTAPRRFAIRAIGPSLRSAGFFDSALADPTLELRTSNNSLIVSNDNWRDNAASAAQLEATGLAPNSDVESAVVVTLSPGAYTATVGGTNNSTGIGLVEIYDLDRNNDGQLTNISTRGVIRTSDAVIIGGFILDGNFGETTVLLRAIGPSLAAAGIVNSLPDPVLELRDSNGILLQSNNNWPETQQAAIAATGISPTNYFEAAILATLPPGSYTAIAAGKDGRVGVGLIEIYNLSH